MFSQEKLQEWIEFIGTDNIEEDPEVEAGRNAEQFLHGIITTNLKYKDSYCFVEKRVPSKKENRRFEIDLIVLTKKQLHVLEVKNWSGKLYPEGDSWIQEKRDGRKIVHPNLTTYQAKKTQVLIEYLKKFNINIDSSYIRQKVLFINPNLHIDPTIISNPDVIPRDKLDKYLKSQKGTSLFENILHSLIEICLDSEKSKIILEGLFNSMPSKEVNKARSALSDLRTWDRIKLNGGKILKGDAHYLLIDNRKIDLINLSPEEKISFNWQRNRFVSLINVVLDKPFGEAKVLNQTYKLNPKFDKIRFHTVGKEKPTNIPLKCVDWFVRG
jgi:Holliday junction resolvase-like predicted endonuclease